MARHDRYAAFLAIGLAMASGPVAGASKCALMKIEEWPVRLVRNHLVVDGAVNDQKVGIMLDTGATRSFILRSAAARLGLSPREARNFRMFGVGGETHVQVAQVDSLRIGQATRKNWQLIVAGEREIGEGIDVILGHDFLHKVDVEFDLAHNAVRLFQAKDCDGASLAYWTTDVPGKVEIEAVFDARPQIVLTVQINGHPIRATLDSGAAASVLTKRDAAAVGVTPETPGVVPVGQGAGLGTKSVDTWIGPFRSFAIGNEVIRDTAIRFSDLFRDATYTEVGSRVPKNVADLQLTLLGADFLRSHRVLVAHSQRKLYFTHAGGPVFQPAGPPAPRSDPRPEGNATPRPAAN